MKAVWAIEGLSLNSLGSRSWRWHVTMVRLTLRAGRYHSVERGPSEQQEACESAATSSLEALRLALWAWCYNFVKIDLLREQKVYKNVAAAPGLEILSLIVEASRRSYQTERSKNTSALSGMAPSPAF